MLHKLRDMGIRSDHFFIAGFASIGLSLASWMVSRTTEEAGIDRADRWGIFIGQWAPTFFALGTAMRVEETHPEVREREMREKEMMRGETKEMAREMSSRTGNTRMHTPT
ncbi:hypothetical protein [Acrocarpospora catenulata]|uniref:hypothetical protein n=1 Tax=Acrocarpospora catenulata TaxID=2836182 RepID=UPI002023AA88|nr:hypothetical protein [Acrocarpospora catenulata]